MLFLMFLHLGVYTLLELWRIKNIFICTEIAVIWYGNQIERF